jgi:dihydroorotase (multifunctional complex type)
MEEPVSKMNLLVVGGTVVWPAGRARLNIGISNGRIAYIGPETPDADATIDAGGLVVLPGGVDTHVHLMDPSSTDRENFPSGTDAAAHAGVTTIIEHTHGGPVRSPSDLVEKTEYLRGRSNVDFGLAAHAWTGESHLVRPLWEAGAAFFKVFTCTTHGVPGHDAGALLAHLQATSDLGARSLIHCEDESLVAGAEEALHATGRSDGGAIWQWRNRDAEITATAVAALLVRRSQAKATIAHVSHREVAQYIMREREAGGDIAAECCPQYFMLREQDVVDNGAIRKFTPPARARTETDEADMWRLLREGVLTHISSDHAPSSLKHKHSGDLWQVHFGLPGVDTTMPALISAVAKGFLSWEDIARVYAEAPARLYGLWPRKGAIRVGFDGDLALVDPSANWTLKDSEIRSLAGWSPYSGTVMRGRVVQTILRGQTIATTESTTDLRAGSWLPGAGYQATPR